MSIANQPYLPLGRSARHLTAVVFILATFFLVDCRHAQVPPTCPAGAKVMGAAPPKGFELWCQKTISGKPVKEGPFVAYASGGDRMVEGTYRNGLQDGEWTLWYENGTRASVDHYVNGLQNGPHTSWYANGQKALEGEYHGGKREGVWTQWDPNGLTSHKMVYREGKLQK